MSTKILRGIVRAWLAGILSMSLTLQAQSPALVNPAEFLKIYVLAGQNAINSIPERHITIPVVEIRDENDLPVEGADVLFELPPSGPGGSFPDNQRVRTARTNIQGQASAPFLIGPAPGSFFINAKAKRGTRYGEAVISQTNSTLPIKQAEDAARPHPWYKSWKVWTIAGAGAAAAGLAIALTGGSGSTSSSAPPTITISAGSPSVSGPR